MKTSEAMIQNKIRCSLSPFGAVFRTNAGEFWQGKIVYSKEFNQNVLINMTRVHGMPEGYSDLTFFGNDGKAAFIETKTATGKATPEQLNFINNMVQRGYSAGIARSTEEALKIIGGISCTEREQT